MTLFSTHNIRWRKLNEALNAFTSVNDRVSTYISNFISYNLCKRVRAILLTNCIFLDHISSNVEIGIFTYTKSSRSCCSYRIWRTSACHTNQWHKWNSNISSKTLTFICNSILSWILRTYNLLTNNWVCLKQVLIGWTKTIIGGKGSTIHADTSRRSTCNPIQT